MGFEVRSKLADRPDVDDPLCPRALRVGTYQRTESPAGVDMCPSVSFEAELAAIRARYARRRDGFAHQARSLLDPERLFRFQERERAVLRFLRRRAPKPLWELRILEIGCGYGGNLLQFARWGCRPENLYANELLEDRLEIARELLPRGVHLLPGDAAALDLEPGSFDIVLQSTVFSSILDPAFRHVLASKMWTWLAPGGAILWYDLRYPNPWNPDVVPIPLGEIRRLFPAGCVYKRSITPLPPVARVVARFGPLPYMLLSAIRPLRTHWLCWIEKQKCDDTGRA